MVRRLHSFPSRPAPERRGVSRRQFLAGSALAGGAALATINLAGCSGTEHKQEAGTPQVVNDADVINVTDGGDYKSVDNTLSAASTWSLPLGTVPFHTDGTWVALMMAPASARVANTLGCLSLSSGAVTTLIETPTLGATYGFFDVRCAQGVFGWIEMDFITGDWTLFGQSFTGGALDGKPMRLDRGNADWEPPRFTCAGSGLIWLKMPMASGSKRSQPSHCYRWEPGQDTGRELMSSPGRFATPPQISDDTLTLTPRVNAEKGVFYGITAVNARTGKQVDQLVMPETVAPFEAVYMDGTFAFSVEANYATGGALGKMGTFIGKPGGPYTFLSREPLACVAGKGSRYLVKAQSSHFVIDTKAQTYTVLPAPDKTLEFGDYPATAGNCDRFVTYATTRGDTGLPEAVTVRVFEL